MGHTHKYLDWMDQIRLDPKIPLSTARRQADIELARSIQDKGIRAFILTNLVKSPNG